MRLKNKLQHITISSGCNPDIFGNFINKLLNKKLNNPMAENKESLEYKCTELGDKFRLTLKNEMKKLARKYNLKRQ